MAGAMSPMTPMIHATTATSPSPSPSSTTTTTIELLPRRSSFGSTPSPQPTQLDSQLELASSASASAVSAGLAAEDADGSDGIQAALVALDRSQKALEDLKFGPRDNIHARFSMPPSAALLERVMATYRLAKSMQVKLSDLAIHEDNDRHHTRHIQKLSLKVLKYGAQFQGAEGRQVFSSILIYSVVNMLYIYLSRLPEVTSATLRECRDLNDLLVVSCELIARRQCIFVELSLYVSDQHAQTKTKVISTSSGLAALP